MTIRATYTGRFSWDQLYDGLDFIGREPKLDVDTAGGKITFSDPGSAKNRIVLETDNLAVDQQGAIVAGTITSIVMKVGNKDGITITGLDAEASLLLPAAAQGISGLYDYLSDALSGNVIGKGDKYDNLFEIGQGGKATVDAGAGDDRIEIWHHKNVDVDGGAGSDVIEFLNFVGVVPSAPAGAIVDLAAGTGNNAFGGTLKIANIENVVGSTAADTITGDDRDNVIGDGLFDGGADIVKAGGGNDLVKLSPTSLGVDVDGGAGKDELQFVLMDANFVLDLKKPANTSVSTGGWTLAGLEVFSVSPDIASGQWTFTFQGSNRGEVVNGSVEPPVILPGEEGLFGKDFIHGGGGKDILNGLSGNDQLWGNAGADILTGGKGSDSVEGGTEADVFRFLLASDSTRAAAGQDTIIDFSHIEHDLLDLSHIDANAGKTGNQHFWFIGTKDFHGKPGEVHWSKEGGDVMVQADTNGDKQADFVVRLDHVAKLVADDFAL